MDAILNAILKTQRSCHAISFRSAWQLRFCIKNTPSYYVRVF